MGDEMNFLRKKFHPLSSQHCTTVFSLFSSSFLKINFKNECFGFNHIYSLEKPLSDLNTIRTVLQSTVRTVVVVVVVVGTGGILNVSP